MKLNDIIQGLDIINVKGELNIDINNVQYDSRKVTKGTLFICIKGFVSDGHKYIKDAIEKGASAFLVEEDVEIKGCTFIKVKDTRKDMAKVADITTILNEILTLNKNKVGLIGTIKIFDGEKDIVSNSTTPESIDLQYHFNNMLDNGCDYCAMEVSSHSLALNRVDETDFKLGIFTNLTPDHLDFHKDLEDYRKAKEKLFFKTTMANIINIDDEGGKKIYENIKGINVPCYTYGVDTNADFMARDIKSDSDGVSYRLITPSYEEVIFIPVPGMFTVYNTLAVIAACYVLGIPKPIYKEGLRLSNGVSGRFETVPNDKGISVIVDYAHTPDALENVLKTTQQFAEGKIIEGIDKKKENYQVVVDREKAISEAISMAKKDDVVIITGKGHETYQIIGKVKHHFDDKEVANECLSKM